VDVPVGIVDYHNYEHDHSYGVAYERGVVMRARREVVKIVVTVHGTYDTEWKSLESLMESLAGRKIRYVHNKEFGVVHIRKFPLADVKGWLADKDVRIEWREIKEKK
jgi:hypothetical protein